MADTRTCPVCEHPVQVRKDGRLRAHGWGSGGRCAGSDSLEGVAVPEPVLRVAQEPVQEPEEPEPQPAYRGHRVKWTWADVEQVAEAFEDLKEASMGSLDPYESQALARVALGALTTKKS